MSQASFVKEISSWYTFEWASLVLGKAKLDHKVVDDATISIPLKTLNRHGLIAWATGTGKTKSVQLLVEWLSNHGIPSLVMDIKGDLSGLAQPGDAENKHIIARHESLALPYDATWFPLELLSLSGEWWVKLRSTVSEFWPLLFSKILWLNNTQESVMSVVFKYCDDRQLGLVDLDDMKTVLKFVTEEWKEEFEDSYGFVSEASVGTIFRKIVALEQQGAWIFFGEPSFDVLDLIRTGTDGKWIINILRLIDMQDRPALFSTFMLSLLAEVYDIFPEAGDTDKPKLVIVIDEAHLVFKQASKELLDQIETVVKLIRSKWIWLIFCTQLPDDIPGPVLSQLGLKIQHQLRWVTQKDRKAIKLAVENYPLSDHYAPENLIMELGIGEAFVTCLNEKWVPTPLAHTYLRAPQSRMDILTEEELAELIKQSLLVYKYKEDIDKDTAHELLQKEIAAKITADWGKAEGEKWWNLSWVLKSKFVKGIASDFTNQIIRGALRKMGLKVHGSRSFIKF